MNLLNLMLPARFIQVMMRFEKVDTFDKNEWCERMNLEITLMANIKTGDKMLHTFKELRDKIDLDKLKISLVAIRDSHLRVKMVF